MKVCLIYEKDLPTPPPYIRAHVERLPAEVFVSYGFVPHVNGSPALSQSSWSRGYRRLLRGISGRDWTWEITWAYLKIFKEYRPDVVLAEFGPAAVHVMEACTQAKIPFVAHFHGYDAHARDVLKEHGDQYRVMFEKAAGIVAVSQVMMRQLIAIGAPPEKMHHIVCGVDAHDFEGGNPAAAPPTFVAVGQFVDRKAPHLTIRAFAKVHRTCPEARLRLVGTGAMLEECQNLARELGIEQAVTFLGHQPHSVVAEEMRQARCFVQHSRVAQSGDCEGTPVAVVEATASGLPVVSTRHAGILDVVIEGETGFLVDENDYETMGDCMLELARDAELAGRMGAKGRQRCLTHYTFEQSIGKLWRVLEGAVADKQSHTLAAAR